MGNRSLEKGKASRKMILGGRVHPHITLANPTQVVGGHLEEGTRVFTFATISIGVLSEALDLSRHDDWNWL